jgi:hypothetical protein
MLFFYFAHAHCWCSKFIMRQKITVTINLEFLAKKKRNNKRYSRIEQWFVRDEKYQIIINPKPRYIWLLLESKSSMTINGVVITPYKLYKVVITPNRVITTTCIDMPDFNSNNSQIYLKWVLGEDGNSLFMQMLVQIHHRQPLMCS